MPEQVIVANYRHRTWTRFVPGDVFAGYEVLSVDVGLDTASTTVYTVRHVGTEAKPGCENVTTIRHSHVAARKSRNKGLCPQCAGAALREGYFVTKSRKAKGTTRDWRKNLPDPATLPPQWPRPPSIRAGEHYYGQLRKTDET